MLWGCEERLALCMSHEYSEKKKIYPGIPLAHLLAALTLSLLELKKKEEERGVKWKGLKCCVTVEMGIWEQQNGCSTIYQSKG